MYSCNQCSKTVSRGDNLKRHEKFHCTDKTARDEGGILFTPASNGVVSKRKVMQLNEHLDDSVSSESSESEDSTIEDIVAAEDCENENN